MKCQGKYEEDIADQNWDNLSNFDTFNAYSYLTCFVPQLVASQRCIYAIRAYLTHLRTIRGFRTMPGDVTVEQWQDACSPSTNNCVDQNKCWSTDDIFHWCFIKIMSDTRRLLLWPVDDQQPINSPKSFARKPTQYFIQQSILKVSLVTNSIIFKVPVPT